MTPLRREVLSAGIKAGRGTPAWSRALRIARRARIEAAIARVWPIAWRIAVGTALGLPLGIAIAVALTRWL